MAARRHSERLTSVLLVIFIAVRVVLRLGLRIDFSVVQLEANPHRETFLGIIPSASTNEPDRKWRSRTLTAVALTADRLKFRSVLPDKYISVSEFTAPC